MMASLDTKAIYCIATMLCVGALTLGYQTNIVVFGVLVICMLMLVFTMYLAQWVLAKDEGTPDMIEVSGNQRAH
jgi:hypothetical protein